MPGRAARPAAKTPSKAKAPASKSSALKKAAKKAPAKASAKKAPVKASAKKAPAKASAQKTPGKKTPAKKTPFTKAPSKKASAKAVLPKATPKQVPSKKAAAKKAPTKKTLVKKQAAGAPKPEMRKAPPAPASTPARAALTTLAAKRAISQALTPHHNDSAAVDAYFRDLDHPFKAEMEAVRAIILGVSPKLSERIKWNAPSFFYKEDLGAFHPRASEYAHLILLFPGGGAMEDDDTGLLEGHHKDRREVKFHNMDDVRAKQPILEKIIVNWLALRDG